LRWRALSSAMGHTRAPCRWRRGGCRTHTKLPRSHLAPPFSVCNRQHRKGARETDMVLTCSSTWMTLTTSSPSFIALNPIHRRQCDMRQRAPRTRTHTTPPRGTAPPATSSLPHFRGICLALRIAGSWATFWRGITTVRGLTVRLGDARTRADAPALPFFCYLHLSLCLRTTARARYLALSGSSLRSDSAIPSLSCAR